MIYIQTNNIKLIFIFGIFINFCFYLIRFFTETIGWLNISVFNVDMFRDFEVYIKWSENNYNIECPYPFFIQFISILKFLPISIELALSIPIFCCNILIGYILYKISQFYKGFLDSQKIIFLYYFNPFTVFYFSMMLLNSCVYVLFILIAFYYLINNKYTLSFIFGIIACLLKENAIVFLIFWSYIRFNIKFTIICLFIALLSIIIFLFISTNIFLIEYIKTRLLITDSYSISLFPKSYLSIIISFILLIICFYYILQLHNLFLIRFLLISLIFDFLYPIGLIKYYLFLSITLYICSNKQHSIILIYILFLIPRIFIHSILLLIIYFIYRKEVKK